ncbi:MAG: S8 family peptidase [Flavobacteriales bacterium]|nr:S8 family peptidase [Flavobacteriales bacterium]
MFHRTLIVLALLLPFTLAAQRTKLNFQLQQYLAQPHAPGEQVDLFVRGEARAVARAVLTHGGTVKMALRGVVSARVPVDRVQALANEQAVQAFEFELGGMVALNDSMRVHNRIAPIHAGVAPLPMPYTGKDVIIGLIDTGLDKNHPDFLDANGRSRVLRFWDQTRPFDPVLTPMPYGYGQAWDSSYINAGTMPAGEQTGFFGHGTTVTGTAAGNGLANGLNKGAAPGADLVIVSHKFQGPNAPSMIADAVHYIVGIGELYDKPVVINASLGSYPGSHDALDATALFIDSILTAAPGRVMVAAGGNSGTFAPYHLRTDVTSDTSFTWFTFKPTPNVLGVGAVYFSLWADTADFSNVRFALGADRVSPSWLYRGRTPFHEVSEVLGVQVTDSLWSLDNNLLGVVDFLAQPRGGQVHLEVRMVLPDSADHYFRFMSTGSGRFDVWSSAQWPNASPSTSTSRSAMVSSGLPTPAELPDIVHYVMPDNHMHIVDSWACSEHVITVANYYNETSYIDVQGNLQTVPGTEGAITPSSSWGPTRLLVTKPDIAATGDITLTCGPLNTLAIMTVSQPDRVAWGGMHLRNGGTSIASPVVAGAAALYLEKCSRAPAAEVKAAFLGTALSDAFTGALPNNTWGAGKLNAFDALPPTNIPDQVITAPDLAFCPGVPVPAFGPPGFDAYLWSNGDSTETAWMGDDGPLTCIVENTSGCRAFCDTLTFTMYPAPAVPVITPLGFTLESSPADAYQWYQDSVAIAGADQQQYEVTVNGTYYVETTDANGCMASSDTLLVVVTMLNEAGTHDGMRSWPVPAADALWVSVDATGPLDVEVRDLSGRMVHSSRQAAALFSIDTHTWSAGSYVLLVRAGEARWTYRFVR